MQFYLCSQKVTRLTITPETFRCDVCACGIYIVLPPKALHICADVQSSFIYIHTCNMMGTMHMVFVCWAARSCFRKLINSKLISYQMRPRSHTQTHTGQYACVRLHTRLLVLHARTHARNTYRPTHDAREHAHRFAYISQIPTKPNHPSVRAHHSFAL